MNKSIQDRLISKNYEIGCLISGGLDSSIIAHYLKQNNSKVNFYSIENNEKYYLDLLLKDLRIDVKYLNYNINEDIENSFRFNETPIDLGSVLPQHKLFSVIPERIVLSGDGADELFGGYKRINDYDSQLSDIFEELTFYHLPRLDRASMRYTIELRNPFLSHNIIRLALLLPYKDRINKIFLKNVFKGKIN
jgi:asparagine synthase (glutamine-hydrolysing)